MNADEAAFGMLFVIGLAGLVATLRVAFLIPLIIGCAGALYCTHRTTNRNS